VIQKLISNVSPKLTELSEHYKFFMHCFQCAS